MVTLIAATAIVGTACDRADDVSAAPRRSAPVTFRSIDGVELSGRLFGPEEATAGVVLAHMLPADQSSWFDFAGELGDAGFRALTFDFRGYCPGGDAGCSEGDKDIAAIWQDAQGAVELLRDDGVERIALVGASMGGTASLIVASGEGDGVAAVVTLSAPRSIEGLTAGPDVVARVTAAKLFLAGTGDGSAAEDAQAFYAQGPPPKRVEILTTDDHGTDMLTGNQGSAAGTLILGWLDRYLQV